MTLSDCMKFIAVNGHRMNPSLSWVHTLLDSLTTNPTMEQLSHLLNGYADLYQMRINLTPCNDRGIIDRNAFDTYQGTAIPSEGLSCYGIISFIMYNYERSQFAPLYLIDNNKQIQSCFSVKEESIVLHMHSFICMYDGKSHFRSNRINQFSAVCLGKHLASLGSNRENDYHDHPPPEFSCDQEAGLSDPLLGTGCKDSLQ